MMDEHLKLHRSEVPDGPHVKGDGSPMRPTRSLSAADAGFADRLSLHGSPSPTKLRYPVARNYCGFEAPDEELLEEPLLDEAMDSSPGERRGSPLKVARDLGDTAWDEDESSGAGSGHSSAETCARRPGPDVGPVDNAVGDQPGPGSRTRRPEVPGYEILEELGRGGMGVVYKARQLRLNRLVALKMILAGDYAGADAIDRFLAEAEIVARLCHPNIVQIHAIGDCEGRPYVELEYVEGGSLALRLDGTPWPPRAAARLVESLATALAETHRLGIVHRDLKPANILMTDDGTPKITDFGLAKAGDKDMGLTRTNSILGSPSYMAPEQAEGRTRDVGPAADIYALGANLYELLTGRPPFLGPTVLATLDLVKNAEPVPPRHLQPGVSVDLETICLKCVQKEPPRRYESADAVAEDLRRYLAGEPILARPTPRWERAWKWIRRRPSSAALIVVTVLSILAAAGGGLWYRADRDRRHATERQRIAGVRLQVDRFVLVGKEAARREDWDGARAQMASALALIRNEPELAPLDGVASRILAMCDARIAERAARTAARARLAVFWRSYDEAVFYQSQYTGLEPEANVRAGRSAARQALQMFEPRASSGGALELPAGVFSPAEVAAITERYYELALILAEATSQPIAGENPVAQASESLQILGRVERVRPPTRAFFLRRAESLRRAGDRAGAKAAEARAAVAETAGDSAVDEFLEGEAAYHRRDYAAAIAALRRVLMRQPGHFWGEYLLAICHLKEHRPAAAQAALTVCQAARPDFVWSLLLKGFAEGEMGEFDMAEADFQRAAELGLDDASRYVMLVNRGVMRVRRGWLESAAADFRAAIALKPDQFQAYVNLAQAYQDLGHLDRAAEALDRAIARFPKGAVLYRARARVRRSSSRPAEALADLGLAIALSPAGDSASADDHLERAVILEQTGRHDEALAECDRALAIQPDRTDIHRVRGAVLVKLRRLDEAIRAFDLCLAKGKPTAALYEARGLAEAQRGVYERAIADYTLALRAGRGTASLHANRGWAYLFSGAPVPASRDFDEALRLEPSDPRALSGRAMANVQQRRVHEAVADARASVQVSGRDARLIYGAARVYCQAAACLESDSGRSRGDWEVAGRYRSEALDLIARSLSLMPAPERAAFWTKVVRDDAALEPIRRSRRFHEFDTQFARTGGHAAIIGVTSR